MPTLEALEGRIETIERRLSEWEGQVGFLVPLVRQLHREILTVREDSQRLENKVDRLENKVDQGFASMSEKFGDVDPNFRKVEERFHRIETALHALPRVVAEEIARRR
jgi:predicted  nucleic acid-binding Zn-ribbon protein